MGAQRSRAPISTNSRSFFDPDPIQVGALIRVALRVERVERPFGENADERRLLLAAQLGLLVRTPAADRVCQCGERWSYDARTGDKQGP
jgi:hypothetical protein